jgi:hypothetical protein
MDLVVKGFFEIAEETLDSIRRRISEIAECIHFGWPPSFLLPLQA